MTLVWSLSRSILASILLLNFMEDGEKCHVQTFGFSSLPPTHLTSSSWVGASREARFSWITCLRAQSEGPTDEWNGTEFQDLVSKQREQEILVSEAKMKLAVAEKKIAQSEKDKNEEVEKWRKKEEKMRALKEDRETELSRLKFQLNELKESLAETENRANEAKQQYSTLMERTSVQESADREAIEKLQQEFSQEEDMLKSQIQTLNEELAVTKDRADKTEELAKEKEQELKAEVNGIQAMFETVKQQVSDAKDKLISQKQDYDKKLKEQRDENDRQRKAFRSVASYDRREIQKEAWDALNQLSVVKYKLTLANKEMKEYRETSDKLEKQVQEMEKTYQERIYDLEDRMEGDQMMFAKAQKTAKEKLIAVMADFKLKLRRQKKESEELLSQTTLGYENQIKELNETYTLEREQLIKEKNEEINRIKMETAEQLKIQAEKYHKYQIKARERLFDEQKRSERQIASLRNEMDRKINWVKQTSDIQKQRIIEEKDQEMARKTDEASRAFIRMESDLTQQLMDESTRRKKSEDQVFERNTQIQELQNERKSFRKLAKMTWKLAREKSANLVRRNKKRKTD